MGRRGAAGRLGVSRLTARGAVLALGLVWLALPGCGSLGGELSRPADGGAVALPAASAPAAGSHDTAAVDESDASSADAVADESAHASSGGGVEQGVAASGADDAALAAAPSDPQPELSGSVAARYRARRAGDQRDHDLFTVIQTRLDQKDAEGRPEWSTYVIGRVAWDLNGRTSDANAFSELEDARGSSLDAQLYEAYFEHYGVDGLDTLRIGRMWLLETPAVLALDGVLAETSLDALGGGTVGAYGGVPHYEYEASPDGDSAGGVYLTGEPWDGGRVRVDWMKVTDERGDVTARNDLYAVQLRQRVAGSTLLRGRYSWIDGTSRDAELAATWHDVDDDVMVHAVVREQFATLTNLVNTFDPFSAVLQAFEPYRQQRLLISKGFDELTLEAGADTRRVSSGDQGPFNREFDRWHATATRQDLIVEGLSLAVTAEQWEAGAVDQRTWGVDLEQQLDEGLKVAVGSYYALFKNDFLLQQERERVRTWYLRSRWRIDPQRTVSLGYEYEVADLDHFNTLTARMSWRF